MASATILRGFHNVKCLVTPNFRLMDDFLYRFSTFCVKMKKIYVLEVWNFCPTQHQFPPF